MHALQKHASGGWVVLQKRASGLFYFYSQVSVCTSYKLAPAGEMQNMTPDIKSHLFAIIDSVIRDYKTQQSYKAI